MIDLKQAIKDGSKVYKEYGRDIFAYTMVLGIILGLIIFTGIYYGLLVLLILFIYLPIRTSLNAISKKVVDHKSISGADFYVGFKNYLSSMMLQSKVVLNGFMWGLLAFVLSLLVGSAIVVVLLIVNEPAVYQSLLSATTLEEMYNIYLGVDWVNSTYNIIVYASLFITGLIYTLTTAFHTFTPYICFETTFTVPSAYILSNKIARKDKKHYLMFSLMFYVIIAIALGVGELLGVALESAAVPSLYAYLCGYVTSGLLAAPFIIYFHIINYEIYSMNYQKEVHDTYMEYVNVSKRVKEEDIINPKDDDHKDDKK